MLDRWRKITERKRLRILSVSFLVTSIMLFVLLFSSLAITASNVMISSELNTESQLNDLNQQYPMYLISQNIIIAFDVLLLFLTPLLVFSVFNFYTKGNLIIIIFTAALGIVRLTFALILLFGNSSLQQGWQNIWDKCSVYGRILWGYNCKLCHLRKACPLDVAAQFLNNLLRNFCYFGGSSTCAGKFHKSLRSKNWLAILKHRQLMKLIICISYHRVLYFIFNQVKIYQLQPKRFLRSLQIWLIQLNTNLLLAYFILVLYYLLFIKIAKIQPQPIYEFQLDSLCQQTKLSIFYNYLAIFELFLQNILIIFLYQILYLSLSSSFSSLYSNYIIVYSLF